MRRLLAYSILCFGIPLVAAEFDPSLQGVRFFAYQLQDFDTATGLQALADSYYDLLVIDQTRSLKDSEDYDSAADVAALHATLGSSVNPKKVVCYLDAGQAEDFRWYWQDGWTVGNPAWILATDPDWPGDYPVKVWDPEWKALMKQNLAMIIADGYDGAYLDWMEIYAFPPLVQAAQAEGKDPRAELIAFIRELRDYARSLKPDFFFIAQNAAEMGAYREWLDLFSGIGQEDVWFTWGDGSQGDEPQDPELTATILSNLALWKQAGKLVFTIEYAQESNNVSTAYANGKAEGFITHVTTKELDHLADTPPPDYRVHNISAGEWSPEGPFVFSPDGEWLAFVSGGLWKVRKDGSELTPILQDSEHYYYLMPGSSWNSKLNRICFTVARSGQSTIWSIKPDGTGLAQVTNGEKDFSATYSPDGTWIVFCAYGRDSSLGVYMQELATGQVIKLSNGGLHPNWSPDGDRIAVSRGNNIWIFDLDGNAWQITHHRRDDYSASYPSFSPDGQWVTYQYQGGEHATTSDLLIVSVDGWDGPHQLDLGDAYPRAPSLASRGGLLAFDAYLDGAFDVWTMPIYLPPPYDHERPVARPE